MLLLYLVGIYQCSFHIWQFVSFAILICLLVYAFDRRIVCGARSTGAGERGLGAVECRLRARRSSHNLKTLMLCWISAPALTASKRKQRGPSACELLDPGHCFCKFLEFYLIFIADAAVSYRKLRGEKRRR